MRVLVTRPEPGASATAQRLVEMGHEPVVLPLSDIKPLPIAPLDISGFGLVVLTSANAVRHAPGELLAVVSHLPVYAVGTATAEAARQAGFAVVSDVDADAEALVRLIYQEASSGQRALYLAGRVRAADIGSMLATAGITTQTVDVYDAVAMTPADADLAVLERPIDAVLVYSAGAANALNQLRERPEIRRALAGSIACCISQRIADMLLPPLDAEIRVAKTPNESGMLALLNPKQG